MAASDPAPWVDGLVEGRRGELVQQKRNRAVWRVHGEDGVYFAKRGTGAKRRELRAEARVLAEMAADGLPVVPLLAAGEHRRAFWIVTAAAPGVALDDALDQSVRAGDDDRRRALLGAAAWAAAALRDAGYAWPDLTAHHVFVTDGNPPVTFLDVARARRERGREGAPDPRTVAALYFSLPYGSMTRADRVRLVQRASGACGEDLREFLGDLESALDRLRLRTRWRHGFAGAGNDVLAAVGDRAQEGGLYDALMDPEWQEVVRTLPDRENRRFTGANGRRFFMKVYPPVRRGLSPAMRERAGLDAFARAGIPVCSEAAYGEDVDRGSFLVVRGCRGMPLDDLLREGVTSGERRRLAEDLGRIWRRMRRSGLRHRDAYACHVFAHRDPTDEGAPRFEVRLIDFTRAGPAPFPRERWFVKDAAQLWHGVPKPPVSRTDAVRWLRAYFDVPRLDRTAKRFARRVAAKERRMAAHGRRKAARSARS